MRNEYELIRMLRKLKTGQLAQIDRPEGVPVPVWTILQDCLAVDPHARPTARYLLSSIETNAGGVPAW